MVFRSPDRDFRVHHLTNVVIRIINGVGIDFITNITLHLARVVEDFFVYGNGKGKEIRSRAKINSVAENRERNTIG